MEDVMSLNGFALWPSRVSVSLLFPTASHLGRDKEKREQSHAGRYGLSFIGNEALYFVLLPSFLACSLLFPLSVMYVSCFSSLPSLFHS
jgi:hypothetical protein